MLRSRFSELASPIEVEFRTVSFVFASQDQGWEFWERTNPPLLALNRMLPPERYKDVVDRGRRLLREAKAGSDGRLVLDSGYLQVVARKASS